MVHNFKKFDEDHSNTIDAVELGNLLQSLELPHDETTVATLLSLVDDDQSGEIDFREFVQVVIYHQHRVCIYQHKKSLL